MAQIRQLAAIMFTDIVGYTALMGKDEERALQVLKKNREIHTELIEKYGGTLIKEIGDGMLISFKLGSDAVRCGIEIQKNCDEEKIPLRVGIHEGEMVFEGNDVFGDGVNIASRIEQICNVGCITISGAVYASVKNKSDIKSEFIGDRFLKNIDEPIKVYQVISQKTSTILIREKQTRQKETRKHSIIVLPFVNISSDPDQEYFSDGLTEEIITDLSHISNFLVISRNSAMTFKGSNKKTNEIAREVNVRYVLEGSVRKSENNLRITAQLIDPLSDSHVWAEKYNGTMDDIFDIQEKVSRSIADALKITLNQKELQQLIENPIKKPQAYLLYQKAQFELYRFREDGLKRALQYLNAALKIEGENPLIYAKIGIIYVNLLIVANRIDRSYLKKARQFADKVFELEPNSSMGHTILGFIELYEGNIRDAVIRVQKAYILNPNNHDNLWLLILMYSYLGKFEEAENFSAKMGEVDPYNPVYNALLAFAYYMKGDLNNAFEEIQKGFEIYPEIPQVQFYYAYFLVIDGEKKEASQILDRFINNTSGSIFSTIGVMFKDAIQGRDFSVLLNHEAEEKLKMDVEWSWLIADFYSMMNKKERAIDWLEHIVDRGFINYPLLSKIDPFLENIRYEERFIILIEKVKNKWKEIRYLDI